MLLAQCPAKHAACGPCAANLASKCPACGPCAANLASKCPACDGAYERDEGAYGYLLAVRVPCPNQAYGCRSSVVYCMAGDHRLVCPHKTCRCPEPGCGFLATPPALRVHLAERHAWPVTNIAYGSVLEVQMQPAEQGQRLLGGGGWAGGVVVQVQGVGARARGHGHRPHGRPDAGRQGGELRGALRGGGHGRRWQVPAGAVGHAAAGRRRGRRPSPHRQGGQGQGEQEPPFPCLIGLPA
uniref:SIAH-type domain-containing protein n=2 Tax=Triticum urartu TaxID=4572 RepID=A0A8R7TQP4_TRIUA